MRNLALLLHRELYALAAERAARLYPAPQFTIREQVAALNKDRHLFKLSNTQRGEIGNLHHSNQLQQAANFYLRLATLHEYQLLSVEIDNTISYIFDLRRAGKKMPKSVTRNGFWKYYLALIRSYPEKDLSRQLKRDIVRFAFVHTLDENDHKLTTGVRWMKDASDIIAQQPFNMLGRFLTKMDREHFELLESRDDYGSVASPYEKQWTSFIPRNHSHMVRA